MPIHVEPGKCSLPGQLFQDGKGQNNDNPTLDIPQMRPIREFPVEFFLHFFNMLFLQKKY
jgi:hypothetical protein